MKLFHKRPKGRWVAVGPIIGNRHGARQRMRWMTLEEAHKYETRTPMPPPGPGGYKR